MIDPRRLYCEPAGLPPADRPASPPRERADLPLSLHHDATTRTTDTATDWLYFDSRDP